MFKYTLLTLGIICAVLMVFSPYPEPTEDMNLMVSNKLSDDEALSLMADTNLVDAPQMMVYDEAISWTVDPGIFSPTTVTIGPVTISTIDGSVVVTSGVQLDKASCEFWRVLARTYPKMFPKTQK